MFSLFSRRARYARKKNQDDSKYATITKITLSTLLTVGITSGMIYAANITSVATQTIASGDSIGAGWYQAVNNKLINIVGSGGNVGINSANPLNYKLVVGGTGLGGGFSVGGSLNGGQSGGDYDSIGYNFRNTATSGLYNYNVNDSSSRLEFGLGGFKFKTAPSGVAGNTVTYADAMTILQNGNVGLGTVSPNAKLEVNGNILTSGVGLGNIGVYDPTKTQAVWSMGAAYVLPAGGGTTTYGSLYGLGWSYNPDYGGAGNNPQSKPGLNHQLLLQMNGVTYTALGNGIWTNGNITSNGSATIAGTVTAASPTASNHLATKAYVDSVAAAGGYQQGIEYGTTCRCWYNGTQWGGNSCSAGTSVIYPMTQCSATYGVTCASGFQLNNVGGLEYEFNGWNTVSYQRCIKT